MSGDEGGGRGHQDVGVILTTYNFLDKTQACLKSLARSTRRPHRLVVVDNASRDGTLDYLRAQGVRVAGSPWEVGVATALNQGIQHLLATGPPDYVAWVHNDMLFFPGWLENLVAVLERRPSVGKLASWNFAARPGEPGSEEAPVFMALNRDHLEPGNGCPWVMPTRVVTRVGPFDERYLRCGGYEDWDYNNRVLAAGYAVAVTKASAVWHETMGTRKHIEQRTAALANRILYAKKWGFRPRV